SISTDVMGMNTGSTSLTVDDTDGAGGQTITVGDMSLDFTGGPSFNYCGADLAGLTLDASSAGGNAITVTGSPQLIAYVTTINDDAPALNPDSIAIGDAG